MISEEKSWYSSIQWNQLHGEASIHELCMAVHSMEVVLSLNRSLAMEMWHNSHSIDLKTESDNSTKGDT